jgi:hypothetical protein
MPISYLALVIGISPALHFRWTASSLHPPAGIRAIWSYDIESRG